MLDSTDTTGVSYRTRGVAPTHVFFTTLGYRSSYVC